MEVQPGAVIMEEYLTIKELCARIKYGKQTIYNLIHRKTFVQGKHFLKPTPKKILFKWSEVQAWIGESPCRSDGSGSTSAPNEINHPIAQLVTTVPKNKPTNLIRI
jgi:excisionase family DNA binding protein